MMDDHLMAVIFGRIVIVAWLVVMAIDSIVMAMGSNPFAIGLIVTAIEAMVVTGGSILTAISAFPRTF